MHSYQKCCMLMAVAVFLAATRSAEAVVSPIPVEDAQKESTQAEQTFHVTDESKPIQLFHPIMRTQLKVVSERKVQPIPVAYVESAQFRRNFPSTGVPANDVWAIKSPTGKYIGMTNPKFFYHKVMKPNQKNLESGFSKGKEEHVQAIKLFPIIVEKSEESKVEDKIPKTMPNKAPKTEADNEKTTPATTTAAWDQAILPAEIPSPFGNLPSHEDYDAVNRFTHSILYGFSSGF